MSVADPLKEKLEQALQEPVLSLRPLHGGCVANVFRLETPSGLRVVKSAPNGTVASLETEAFMLDYLRENSDLPVPSIFSASETLLIMEYLPGQSRFNADAQAHAGELLAALHQVSAPRFGLERDTLIGSLPQPNSETYSWLAFFRDQRIWAMAQAAQQEGRLSNRLLSRLERFCENLDTWLEESERPALLHGDVWTTNILAEGGQISGFIDPAIYYGHPEIELAFSTLFATFPDNGPFFRRYDEINPIAPGFFEIRRDLYNLYPLLVHVRLFGSSYEASIDRILRRIGL